VQEVSVRTVGGGVQSVAVAASMYKDPDGRPWNILRIGELKEERRDEKERIAKMMTHSILQAQERERKRISRELHDGIGQSLYSTLIHLDVIAGTLEEGEDHPAWKRIDDLQHTLRQTIEDIRHLSAELRPSVLDDMGLLAALRNYIQTFGEKFGIQVNFSYEGDRSRLPASYETALYRIAQEALTNAAKYAETDRVDVALLQEGEEVVFSVRDYGIGFDSGGLERRGVGLYSMEERAEILDGSFALDSEEGKGTTIMVRLPLQREGIQHGHSSASGR
jgi:two-component system, NarL family, sensor histidine kinase NreB